MMKEYAARINKRIAHYLQVWEAPFRLYLDDSLSFQARFDTGFELPAARLSGGQKIVASTSFRLAMSDTFAKNVGLLILDEPTNHLDKENVVHLQQLLLKLKQFAGTAQRQIIIVTHEEQLVNFFDHTIQLAKIG
jgi:DNA repair exonuclease SbcCD ATPase subunit